MLLRVKVFPASLLADTKEAEEGGATTTTALPAAAATHFASLSTATKSSPSSVGDGQIWSLGRKQGTYHATADKSVSREHVILSIASTNPSYLQKTDSDNDATSALAAAAAAAPCTTPAQVEACDKASDQLCVLLRNLGKLGSYLVIGETDTSSDDNGDKASADDKKDDDSDTADDEEIIKTQQSQAAAAVAHANAVLDVTVSDVAKHLVGAFKTRLQAIAADESIVLDSLCNDHTAAASHDTKNRQRQLAVVQCGKLGTTVALQRVYIRLVVSSDAKKAVSELEPYFYTVGCRVEDNLLIESEVDNDDEADLDQHINETMESILSRRTSMTFLVTEKCVAKPKHLTAWSRGIPMVTSAFVRDLCNLHGQHRKSPVDPFPLYKDYVPPFDDRDFWRNTSNPKLWSTCTFLSVKNDENETLIQAAGAKIVPLYMSTSSTSKSSMMDESAIQETVDRETLLAPSSCFALDNRVAATKVLKQKGVPLFSAKDIAKGITQQEMLKDRQGTTVGGQSLSVRTTAAVIAETEANTKNDRKRKGRSESSHGEPTSDSGPNKKPCSANVLNVTAQSDEHGDAALGDTTMTTTASELESYVMQVDEGHDTSVATTKRRNAKAKAKQVDETPAKNTNHGDTTRVVGDKAEELDEDTTRAKAASKPPKAAAAPSAQSAEQSKVGFSVKRKPTSSTKQRPLGPKTNVKGNGWLEALPQGTKRLEHRRSNDEIREITGQDHFYQAETVKCKISKPPGATASRTTTKTTTSVSGPDFRAFRKNNVPKQTQDVVTVRTEVTKESEHRQNLEKLREDNEAQQRRVDALFG